MPDKPTIDKDLIRDLAGLMDETGLTEIEIETGKQRVRVARGGTTVAMPQVVGALPVAAAGEMAPSAGDHSSHPGAVLSPMVGTAYISPEPDTPPFAKVGDQVTAGQTLLIVEAMKTMNPIPSPKSGTVTLILVSDGSPVEYGEALMIIE